ncbi:Lipopolysaccharide biosynthesis protein, LPS:glycosyltransferase [Nonomuraea solani]|uniref:Lipopolysaccharide biosynthesis protein, LPS:glycosyltransferase n=1 Tax=Nonomuraea solani TaxID=1144553 RepID=A0A1H6EVI1_9ACTN|nr:glycosyltransferase family 8 protein [Nonomuraea solani]SEH01772.1 Lipopolysaccharide biosynthesis protein, LPS:glycosyltransferase [Nonomuraea solani]
MMERPPAPIVCCVDDGYVRPLTVLLQSLAAVPGNAGLRIWVLHENLSFRSRALLHRHGDRLGLDVGLRPITPAAAGPVSGWVSEAVYLRLEIGQTLGDQERVLYLDADILVLGELRPLLLTDLGSAALGAVRDAQNPVIGAGIALPGWAELRLPHGRDYFNSGVMLMDLPVCERQGLFTDARRFLIERPDKVVLWDQDALNVAAADRWLRLERRWNTFALSALAAQPGYRHADAEPYEPLATLLADEPHAAILHYAGPAKPWQQDYPPGRLKDTYQRFLQAVVKAESDAGW